MYINIFSCESASYSQLTRSGLMKWRVLMSLFTLVNLELCLPQKEKFVLMA